MNDTDLADTQRRMARADVLAAAHHLQLADEALQRALGRIPVPELFADDTSADDMIIRSFLRSARNRVITGQMLTRKAKEQFNGRQD